MKNTSFAFLFAILAAVASAGSLRNQQQEDAQQHGVVPSSDSSTILQDNHLTQASQGASRSRHLFFQGANTLSPGELISESFARILIAILDYLILGPLVYYWSIAAGGWNFYPALNKCLKGPPPFEKCLVDSGLKS
jgi:hypothetical protein